MADKKRSRATGRKRVTFPLGKGETTQPGTA